MLRKKKREDAYGQEAFSPPLAQSQSPFDYAQSPSQKSQLADPLARTPSPPIADALSASPSSSATANLTIRHDPSPPLYRQVQGSSSSSNLTGTAGRARYQHQQQQHSSHYAQWQSPFLQHQHTGSSSDLNAAVSGRSSSQGQMQPPSGPAMHSQQRGTDQAFPASTSVDHLAPAGRSATGNGQSSQPSQPLPSTQFSMGRSQSAFNFILSKAKAPFSSSSATTPSQQQQQHQTHHQAHPMSQPSINASSSLSSMYSNSGQSDELNRGKAPRNRSASSASALNTAGPPPIAIDRSQDQEPGPRTRYHSNTSHGSFGEENAPASSPTKRNLFGRERKMSASSNSSMRAERGLLFGNAARTALSHSPLGRGLRQDSSGSSAASGYPLFSKSQIDLHTKSDFPSPPSNVVDLPQIGNLNAVPTGGAPSSSPGLAGAQSSGDSNFLRSPNKNAGFSRSVDDLQRGLTPPPQQSPGFVPQGLPSPVGSRWNEAGGGSDVWGEQGVATSDRGRASDVGTLKPDARRFERGAGAAAPVGIGLSNVSSSISTSPSFDVSRYEPPKTSQDGARHQRKGSKQIFAPREAGSGNGALRADVERPALGVGVAYEGLLNRNANISLSIHQLNDGGSSGGGKGKEKDISKGWKPYRVVLREGKLYFFKPSSAVAEDAKALFPTTLVEERLDANEGVAMQRDGSGDSKVLGVDELRKLGTRDLLSATSSNGGIATADKDGRANAPSRRNDGRLSAIMDADEPVLPDSIPWERRGRHDDLVLTPSSSEPGSWAERVQGGSVDALSHEYVFATQVAPNAPSAEDCGSFLFAILLTLRRTSRPMQGFLFAIQKWATMALAETTASESEGESASGKQVEDARLAEFKAHVRARLALVADCGVVSLVDEQAKASVMHALEDIVRDSISPDDLEHQEKAARRVDTLQRQVKVLAVRQSNLASNKAIDQLPTMLSSASLLKTDPTYFARQIHVFHHANVHLSTLSERSIFHLVGQASETEVRMLAFDTSRPHFLTGLVMEHILGHGFAAKAAAATTEEGSQQDVKERATILRHWIAVASYLLRLQNAAAWLAVAAAICSRAVSRLTQTWRSVASSDRQLISKEWVPVLAKIGYGEVATEVRLDSLIDEIKSVRWSLLPSSGSSGEASQADAQAGTQNVWPYLGKSVLTARALTPLDSSSGFLAVHESSALAEQLWTVAHAWATSKSCGILFPIAPQQSRKDDELQQALYDLLRYKPSTTTTTAPIDRRARRMTALFRGAVPRIGLPSSSSPSTNTSTNDTPQRSFNELLAAIPAQKATLVLLCGSSRLSVWRNHQRSFIINLSPPDGGHVLLQANDAKELQAWCQAIERTSKEYAGMHISSAEMAKKGSAGGASNKGSKAPIVPLYGTDIKTLAEHEGRPVPLGLLRMLEEVEKRGLREQGIYRISGAKSAIEALKTAFSQQPTESIALAHGELSDIHTIAGAIKQWFRDLPEPAVPFRSYRALIEAERMEHEEQRLYAIRDIIWDFPRPHFELLKRISVHLAHVCDEGKYNLMAPHNIGLVFGTSLLNPPPGPASVAESFGNIGKAAHIVKIIVTTHEWLFEPEPEAGGEAEADEVEDETAVEAPEEATREDDETVLQGAEEKADDLKAIGNETVTSITADGHAGHIEQEVRDDTAQDDAVGPALQPIEKQPAPALKATDSGEVSSTHADVEDVATPLQVTPSVSVTDDGKTSVALSKHDSFGLPRIHARSPEPGPALPPRSPSRPTAQRTFDTQISSHESEGSISGDAAQQHWIAYPLVSVDEGTIDSHASESSMMRAVLGADPSSERNDQRSSIDTAAATTTTTTDTSTLQRPSISRASSTQQVFLDAEEGRPVTKTALSLPSPHGARTTAGLYRSGSPSRREQVVESVYLDAAEAIGIIHSAPSDGTTGKTSRIDTSAFTDSPAVLTSSASKANVSARNGADGGEGHA